MMSLIKNQQTQQKNFLQVQTRRLAASFESLNSGLPLSTPELCAHKAMCDPVVLARKSVKRTGRQRVNTCHESFSSSHWG